MNDNLYDLLYHGRLRPFVVDDTLGYFPEVIIRLVIYTTAYINAYRISRCAQHIGSH